MSQATYNTVKSIATSAAAEVVLAVRSARGGADRLVVIKRLLPHVLQDPEYVDVFVEESRHAALLNHPNTVPIIEVQRDDSGCFAASEYVSGEDLRVIIGKARAGEVELPVPVACRILSDLAAGLHYGHMATGPDGQRAGLLHRDAGPSNIIVGYDGVSRWIDFGIARADVANIYSDPNVLKERLAYMSPEQARHAAVDARSDLFSLGVVGWELLTSMRLFQRATQAAVQQAIVQTEPAPPSSINPAVPALADEIILTALAKAPQERFASVQEMGQAVDHVLASLGESGTTHATSNWMKNAFADLHRNRVAMEKAALSRRPGAMSAVPSAAATSAPRRAVSRGFGESVPVTAVPAGAPADGSVGNESTVVDGMHPGFDAEFEPAPRKNRVGVALLIGALALLVLVAALGAGIWLSRKPGVAMSGSAQQPEVPPFSPPAVESQKPALFVRVTPAEARLLVDGRVHSRSVGEGVRIEAAAGTQMQLRVEHEGYQSFETIATVPARGDGQVHVSLRREGAKQPTVAVEGATADSDPGVSAAVVTPPAQKAPAVTKPVRTARRSRERDRGTQRARSARRAKKAPVSPKAKQATLVVVVSPASARVTVDGRRQRRGSPLRLSRLQPGAHAVGVSAPGYASEQRTVELAAGRSLAISVELNKSEAQLDIVSVPSGAEILVDGKPRGRAPLMGLKVSPNKVHRIEARLDGHKSWTTRVTPDEGRNPSVVATLERIPERAIAVVAPRVTRDVTVPRSMVGDPSRGAGILGSRCSACHGSKASPVSARRYTREQWSRYFSSRRHSKKALFKDRFSRSDLAHVKAYLMSKAADVTSATAAGVR